jgi:hypothetical protein
MTSRYQPKWDIDLAYGHTGEQRVADLLGIGAARVEVKTPREESLNLYVETHQYPKRALTAKPSGLRTTEAEVWVYNMHGVLIMFRTDDLRAFIDDRQGSYSACKRGDNPTGGQRVNLQKFVTWLARGRSMERPDRLHRDWSC